MQAGTGGMLTELLQDTHLPSRPPTRNHTEARWRASPPSRNAGAKS